MGMNPYLKDNLARNMALNVNAMEYERKRDAAQQMSGKKRMAGKIAFWTLLAVVVIAAVLIIAVF